MCEEALGGHGADFEDGTVNLLKVGNHLKEVASLRIPARAKHPHKTLRRLCEGLAKCHETDRSIDILAQNGLGCVEVSREHVVNGTAKELAAEVGVCEVLQDGFAKTACQWHSNLSLSVFVFLPKFLGRDNVSLLPLLCAAIKKKHEPFAVLTEVDPVSRTKVEAKFGDAHTNAFSRSQVPRLHAENGDIDTCFLLCHQGQSANRDRGLCHAPSHIHALLSCAMVTQELPLHNGLNNYFLGSVPGRCTFGSRRLAPWKGSIQPGYSGGRALTSSSCFISSGVSWRSTAAMLSVS